NGMGFPLSTGAFQTTGNSTNNVAFVAKFDTNGTPVYSTFLGGTGTALNQKGAGIAVDSATGNAYVTGDTNSSTFPVTASTAFQATKSGGSDAFVTGLNAQGNALVYSTYIGGSGNDEGHGIAFQGGAVTITGASPETNFPTTTGVVKASAGFANTPFAARFNPGASGASSRVWSTYIGGDFNENTANAVAVGANGNVYITGDT